MRLWRRRPTNENLEEWVWPYRGTLIWLAPGQGGRENGPLVPAAERGFLAATAYVPPRSAQELASFLLRGYDATVLTSPAEGRWLVPGVEAFQNVGPGDELVVTDGARPVARFHVTEVVGA